MRRVRKAATVAALVRSLALVALGIAALATGNAWGALAIAAGTVFAAVGVLTYRPGRR